MSDKLKKDAETKELLEEVEDLSIGAGAGTILNPGISIVSSAMPPITIKYRCEITLTKDAICKGKTF